MWWKVSIPLKVITPRDDAVYDYRDWQKHVDKHYRLDAVTPLILFPQKVRIHERTLYFEADKNEYLHASSLKEQVIRNAKNLIPHPFWVIKDGAVPIAFVKVIEDGITIE